MDLDMKILDITGGQLASEGYETNGFGLIHFKDDLFSEANSILQSILYNPPQYDYSWSFEIVMDHEAEIHPDVYQAWIAAGGEEGYQTVAKLPELGKWGLGFGGKKNGERAAKLALAASVAMTSELTPQIVWEYPRFGELMSCAQWQMEGGGCGGGGYVGGKGGKSGGKGARAGPYGDAGFDGGGFDDAMKGKMGAMMSMMGKMGGKGKMGKMGKMAAMMSMMAGGDDASWWGGDGGGGWGGGKGKGGGKGEGGKGPLNQFPADTKVWVGNLPEGMTSSTLEEHFALSGGTVVGALVMRNSTGCVAYQNAEEAEMAIAVLNGTALEANLIQVDVWSSK